MYCIFIMSLNDKPQTEHIGTKLFDTYLSAKQLFPLLLGIERLLLIRNIPLWIETLRLTQKASLHIQSPSALFSNSCPIRLK